MIPPIDLCRLLGHETPGEAATVTWPLKWAPTRSAAAKAGDRPAGGACKTPDTTGIGSDNG
jgi:hypothetical protein